MEYPSSNNNDINMWEWRGEDYCVPTDPQHDVQCPLWDDVNQDDDCLLYMLRDHTPFRDSGVFGYESLGIQDFTKPELEECQESSLVKRRRMLQFTSDANDRGIGNEQTTSTTVTSTVTEGSLTGKNLQESFHSNIERNSPFADNMHTFTNHVPNQSSDGWLASTSSEGMIHCSSNEMSCSRNSNISSNDQVTISEFCDMSPEVENDVVKEATNLATLKVFKGRKSFIKAPKKLTTSIAYPFTLIKPCGVQGNVTLKDINQRIRAPPPSRSKHKRDDDPWNSYPTSAFSGKPVVGKTKVQTEGGKGSITILRTKG
ncbi:protein XRI1-like isoform X2 [Typha latifolia]|uniref:protein XRI1-like isoform X2 n=1 Tax=Typha latifolia TaxID=4733 RepID=UPI003C2C217A